MQYIAIPEVAFLLTKIDDAMRIAEDMLGAEVEPDIRVPYCREILRAHDQLSELKKGLNVANTQLRLCEESLSIVGHFDRASSTEITRGRPMADKSVLNKIKDAPPSPTEKRKVPAIRPTIRIRVTRGMIQQNLFSLTQHMHPRGPFKIGDEIQIVLNGEKLTTNIVSPGNKLRARGAVGRFYQDLHVQPNDNVMLSRDDSGVWHASVERGTDIEKLF